jgi:hypothetical protein
MKNLRMGLRVYMKHQNQPSIIPNHGKFQDVSRLTLYCSMGSLDKPSSVDFEPQIVYIT